MPLSTLQIAAIASATIAVGSVAAVKTGMVKNPFEEPALTTSAPSAPAATANAPKPASVEHAKVAKAKPAICHECGTVASIESFTEKGQATGGGAIAGGVIGGIVGHQIGKGRGKDLATIAGAVGGALAGHEVEKNVKKVTRYRIALRMDDGTNRELILDAANGVNVGDKVKIVEGQLLRN